MTEITFRPARDDDADSLIAMVDGCYREYAGCVLMVDEEEPELKTPASTFARWGGRFWVAEGDGGRIVASGAVTPTETKGEFKVHKVFIANDHRRRGLASQVCALIEDWARSQCATVMILYTDTRFSEAHALYERLGYTRDPAKTRDQGDASNTIEYFYRKSLV